MRPQRTACASKPTAPQTPPRAWSLAQAVPARRWFGPPLNRRPGPPRQQRAERDRRPAAVCPVPTRKFLADPAPPSDYSLLEGGTKRERLSRPLHAGRPLVPLQFPAPDVVPSLPPPPRVGKW